MDITFAMDQNIIFDVDSTIAMFNRFPYSFLNFATSGAGPHNHSFVAKNAPRGAESK